LIDKRRRVRANWILFVVLAAVALAMYVSIFVKLTQSGPG
jgi:hypothetical protein